jgi:NTP pyrophosphatase (non-canonical NTP hydrolase)
MDSQIISASKQAEEIFTKAVKLWGVAPQFNVLQEECGELIAATNQYDRGKIPMEDLVTEVADVLLTAYQIKMILGPAVEKEIQRKLDRLEKRINEASNTLLPKHLSEISPFCLENK